MKKHSPKQVFLRGLKSYKNHIIVFILLLSIVTASSFTASFSSAGSKSVNNDINISTDSSVKGGMQGMIIEAHVSFLNNDKKSFFEANPQFIPEVNITFMREDEGEITDIITLTTIDQVATTNLSLGGVCKVSCEEINGFTIENSYKEIELIKTKGNFVASVEFVYVDNDVPATEIEISGPTDKDYMVVGEEVLFTAEVQPFTGDPNTSAYQEVLWTTGSALAVNVGSDVAKIDSIGHVTAISEGSISLIAESIDTNEYGYAVEGEFKLEVEDIESINTISTITGAIGDVITLPNTIGTTLTNGIVYSASVIWEGVSINGDNQFVIFYTTGERTITGHLINGAEIKQKLEITGEERNINYIKNATLSDDFLSLFVETENLDINTTVEISINNINYSISDETSSYPNHYWIVDDENIAVFEPTPTTEGLVLSGFLVGKGEGETILRVVDENNQTLAFCILYVAINPALTDTSYILAVEYDDNPSQYEEVDQFDEYEDIYIVGYNLPAPSEFPDNPNNYYSIKIQEMYQNTVLGEGKFIVSGTEWTEDDLNPPVIVTRDDDGNIAFYLKDVLDYFEYGDSYSESYFVSISPYTGYPTGDVELKDKTVHPKTWVDNLKITSPVPTVDKEDIHINIISYDDKGMLIPLDSLFNDYDKNYEVVLARLINEDGTEQIYDYYSEEFKLALSDNRDLKPSEISLPADVSRYTDEVKLDGVIRRSNNSFSIEWNEPRETVKIGGYVLLIQLDYNPYSKDIEIGSDIDIPTSSNSIYSTNLDQVNYLLEATLIKEVSLVREIDEYYRTIVIRPKQ